MSVISLDDLNKSSTTEQSSTETNDDSGSVDDRFEELESLCDDIGADYENAKGRAVDDDGVDLDDLLTVARNIRDSDDLHEIMETYRAWNDKKRIVVNYLYNLDAEFGSWLGAFWGDNDDPEPGTYNYARNQSRDRDDNPGGLYTYKALFPEPAEEYWDEDIVLLIERDDDDSHIYVEKSWVTEYGDFTMDVNGQEVPRPPSDSELESGAASSSSSDSSGDDNVRAPFDPAEFTINELTDELNSVDYDVEQLEVALDMEKRDKGRKGAKNALRDAIDDAESTTQETLDDSGSDDESPEEMAGRLLGQHGFDISPDAIVGMAKGGMSEEDIIEALE